MSSSKAYINYKILKQVREDFGFSLEKASKNVLPPKKLEKVESGYDYLTFKQLKKIAYLYKLPMSYFYLNEKNKNKIDEKFRSLKSKSIELTPELQQAINEVNNKRDLVIEFKKYEEEKYDYTFVDCLSYTDDITLSAMKVVSFLNINDMKEMWRDDYSVLNSWIQELTKLGILIFQVSSIPVDIMRGFSISKILYPIIVINNKDGPMGRVFSLIHELIHVCLQDDEELAFAVNVDQTKIESFCNKVTAEILIPENDFLSSRVITEHNHEENWSEEELTKLHRLFWVSKEAILLRLLNFKLTNNDFYKTKIEEWKLKGTKSGFGPKPHKKVINQNSNIFLKVLLSAYNDGEYTSAKLSNILNMKLKHLEKLEREFWN